MRRVVRFLVGFAVVVVPSFWSAAHSANVLWSSMDSVVVRGADGSVRAVPGVRQMFANAADGVGGVNATASQRIPVGAAAADVAMAKNVPKSAVAVAGRVAAKVLGPVALGVMAYDIAVSWDDNEQRWEVPGLYDPLQPGVGADGLDNWSSDYMSGCNGGGAASNKFWYEQSSQDVVWGKVSGDVAYTLIHGGEGWEWMNNCAPDHIVKKVVTVTPLVSVAASDGDLETAIFDGLTDYPLLAPQILDTGMEQGYQPAAQTPTVSGPSSVPGPSTTTTSSGPSGQTTTTSNTTHNLTYNTNVVTVTNTTTTTVTAPDNSVTTTTVTSSPPAGGEPVDEDKKTLCEETPNASACQELGDPEDEELEEQTEDVSFEQEGGASGSCPASEPFWAGGTAQELSWQPTCDFASGIRPFVIGLAWLSAGIFVFAIASRKA